MMRFTLALLLMVAGGATAKAELIRTENFDTDPGWTSVGSGLNGNEFGFRPTANAGGAPGEAGGTFTRSDFVRFYGDTNIGGVLTFADEFSASGLFGVTSFNFPDFGRTMILGHFSTTGEGKIGIGFSDNSTGDNLFWFPRIRFDDGVVTGPGTPAGIISLDENTMHTWSYSWDPTGGIFGTGALAVTLDKTQLRVDLPASKIERGLTVDAFGLAGTPSSSDRADKFAELFIDDVSYTVVPEPSSMALMTIGTLSLCALGVVKYRRRMVHPAQASSRSSYNWPGATA